MLAGWPISDIDSLRARQAKMMLAGELRCPYHTGVRHRAMLPRNNPGLVPEIPRVNRTTIFKTRPHITKGFHLNDGLTSNPATHKGVLPKLSVTSLSKLKSQDFNALHFPKPLRKGFSTNSFDSRIPGKSLMSTAQYYELKKIYGEKPGTKLDRILCRNKSKSNYDKRGRETCCPLHQVQVGAVQIGGKCLPPQIPKSEFFDSPEALGSGALPLGKFDTKSSESLDTDDEKVTLPTPDDTIECPVNTPGSTSPSKVLLAPLKVRDVQHHSPAANTFKPRAETLADFMTSKVEHALWLHQQDLRMSPAILTDCPKILSRLSNVHLPGLANRPSPLAGSCHHLRSESQGELYHHDTLTPVATRPTPVSTLDQNKSVTGQQRLRPKLINVGPDLPADLQVVSNKPRVMSKLFGGRRHMKRARRSSNKHAHDGTEQDKVTGGSKKADLNIKGTQMQHKANSHLLNYLNYSRDYRMGHVNHAGASCDRMESHWIANDLLTLSQQKLGKGLLPADWEFGEDEDGGSVNTRLTSSPVESNDENIIHLLCGSNSADEMWLRNISMIMACSTCSSSEMDTFSSGSASPSSSVSVTTSTTDLLMNLPRSQAMEMAAQDKDGRCADGVKESDEKRVAVIGATLTTPTSDVTVTQTCTSSNSDPARAYSQTSAVVSGVQQPPSTPASPSSLPQNVPRLADVDKTQVYPPSAFPANTTRTDWHSMNMTQGPLASIVLKHSARGKAFPGLRMQDKSEDRVGVKKRINLTQEKRGKVWRRKKRVPKVESKSVCDDADNEGLSLDSTGCVPELTPSNWKKPGLLCFTPMYDARYDQWKRRRARHKDLSRKMNLKRTQIDKCSEGEESEGCSDSDEGGLWQSAGASTTVDPHSSSSESDREATDVMSSAPLSPVQQDVPARKRRGSHDAPLTKDGDNSDEVNWSLQADHKPRGCVSRRLDDKIPMKEMIFEAKSSRIACRLPSVPEQDATTVETKEETSVADNTSVEDQPVQSENLAKKLKAIFKRKPTSSIDVPEPERGLPRDGRISSAPGRTSIWLTESLAVSSIGPPPSSELMSVKIRQGGTSEKVKRRAERPEKCARSEKPPKKVTLQEILRFLPNIGVTAQEPAKECSHDLTRVLPSGRRADITLCQSCICKMAMAQTASKTTPSDGKPTAAESSTSVPYSENAPEGRNLKSAMTFPTTVTGKNPPTMSQSTAGKFKPETIQLPKRIHIPTAKLESNPELNVNGAAQAESSEKITDSIKNSTESSSLLDMGCIHLPESNVTAPHVRKEESTVSNG